jgi:inorganic triphosphatase YgiF
MAEVEIKLQVPAAALADVRASVRRGRCAITRLRAIYADTPDERLAAAGWVLRLRKEGRRWVQAVKGPGDGVLARFEHEVVLGTQRAAPAIDVMRHADAPGFDAFLRALGDGADTLAPVFETDVRRTHRIARVRGATIEIALDEGEIVAAGRREPVCEIEFELKAGSSVPALAAMAATWAERHGLWLDVQTKAERGQRLARGQSVAAPTHAAVPRLAPTLSADAALRACVRTVLVQVLRNASSIVSGRAGAEHVHQVRVGLRRLFSLQRELGAWSVGFDAALLEAPAQWFKALGGTRDVDALAGSLLPQLQADGAPPSLRLPAPVREAVADPAAVFRAGTATRGLLALLAFAHGTPDENDDAPADLRALAAPVLARLHRRLRRAGKAFDGLDDDARHRARKQLKRLRYVAECLSDLWPEKAWLEYLRRLKRAQDALGHFQDLCVAQTTFESLRASEPTAWFALGWIAARRHDSIAQSRNALRDLGPMPKFLR